MSGFGGSGARTAVSLASAAHDCGRLIAAGSAAIAAATRTAMAINSAARMSEWRNRRRSCVRWKNGTTAGFRLKGGSHRTPFGGRHDREGRAPQRESRDHGEGQSIERDKNNE